MLNKKLCTGCMRWFQPKLAFQKYCSDECRDILHREVKRRKLRQYREKRGQRKLPDKVTCCICGRSAKPHFLKQKTCGDSHCKRTYRAEQKTLECFKRKAKKDRNKRRRQLYDEKRMDGIRRPQTWYPSDPFLGSCIKQYYLRQAHESVLALVTPAM